MPASYATKDDLAAYVEGSLSITDAGAIDRLLMRAEDDIDMKLLPSVDALQPNGRKLDPATLTADEKRALNRATCAQAEYRDVMGETFFRRHQFGEASSGRFSTRGKLGTIGPKTRLELSAGGLLQTGARAVPGNRTPTGVPTRAGGVEPAYPWKTSGTS